MEKRILDVLVGCEESQEVTSAFIKLGHRAMSCDLYYDGAKGLPHYRGDVREAIRMKKWDIIILHPPCTYTCVSGNRWYHDSPLRHYGAVFCVDVWELSCEKCNHVALEQPKTIMQRWLGKRSQTIQPYQFGHGETKETWLWLYNLPNLIPTNEVNGRAHRVHEMAPSIDRGKKRSATYPGIADAFAVQWSEYVMRITKLEISNK